jgi:serine protease Do
MSGKISLRTAGIIAGAAAVFAFLFGIIITASIPTIANRGEAHPENILPVPLVTEEGESPFTKVAEMVSPSVVNISAERKVSGSFPGFEWRFEGPFDEFFRDFFRDFPKYEGKTQTLGSGFLISDDGYIVTNYHVIKDASNIVIKMINKKEYKGDDIKIIGTDQRTDLALLKIETGEKFSYLKLGDSDKVKVGDWAIAVGNPFHLEGTVTVGVISAKGRTGIPLPEGPDFQSFIQTDAAINPGNSGGPLVNIYGEVIGINTAITSPTGGNVGIGFAIPASLAQSILDELKSTGKVTRAYLGVYLQDITEELREALDLPSLDGALISEVVDDTPASKAGVQDRDVVIEFDNKKVKDVDSFRMMVASTQVGKKVKMKVIRDSKEKTLSVTLAEFSEDQRVASTEEPEQFELGLKTIDVTDPQAQRFNIEVNSGVVVVDVKRDSPADEAGIAIGDVILAIGQYDIRNVTDYQSVVSKLKKGKPVIFYIQRGSRKRYVAVTP